MASLKICSFGMFFLYNRQWAVDSGQLTVGSKQ